MEYKDFAGTMVPIVPSASLGALRGIQGSHIDHLTHRRNDWTGTSWYPNTRREVNARIQPHLIGHNRIAMDFNSAALSTSPRVLQAASEEG